MIMSANCKVTFFQHCKIMFTKNIAFFYFNTLILIGFTFFGSFFAFCLVILTKAVKLTKTDMDDQLLEVVTKAIKTREDA